MQAIISVKFYSFLTLSLSLSLDLKFNLSFARLPDDFFYAAMIPVLTLYPDFHSSNHFEKQTCHFPTMKRVLFWDKIGSHAISGVKKTPKQLQLMEKSVCIWLCVGADYYLKKTVMCLSPCVPPCCSYCITHVKEQECVCNPSSIGSHLFTLEMADLKCDNHLEWLYVCVCMGGGYMPQGWNSRDRQPLERKKDHLVSLQGCAGVYAVCVFVCVCVASVLGLFAV